MNDVENGAHDVQPTETTALLTTRTPPGQGDRVLRDADLCPIQLKSRADETAFSLIVLLYARYNVLEQWQTGQRQVQDLHLLDQRLLGLWSAFLAQCHSELEVEAVLWMSFPYEKQGRESKRVVDFLSGHPVLEEFLTHPVVLLSIRRTWRRGWVRNENERPFPTRLVHRFDALCTPRVLHAIDLILLMAYLATLAHFLVFPPSRSIDPTALASPDSRERALMLYPVAKLFKPPVYSVVPYILVLGAFTSHLPQVPYPDDVAYGVLLFAFSWMIIDLHLPMSTSPLHLFPAEVVLPRSVLILHGIARIFIPVVTFFLPALLLSLFLLSTSLADLFPNAMRTTFAPAPIESRVAFLSLFAVLFLLMVCSLVMLVLVYPSFASQTSCSSWDRCSKPIGLEARRFFIRTVIRYSTPYVFPAPFNLLQICIRVPAAVLTAVCGGDNMASIHAPSLPERIVWRVTIAPLGVVFGAFWLWGLKSR
ncbi:uncharacterized protein B0H18DRAFT_971495 [Fomitopsis serialis]|uniref:uncharacterized protein n=1 Tax=Fomitopsis serialis TaxID=139415 RepID=UPI00200891B4|nr:uncharacterized protein B0H18DRAFT_971495 [Neoantrodia serialis]KAH9937627.1 hypothetical protein B0H18DRAFT_971495 [Neoantrodia serialis]